MHFQFINIVFFIQLLIIPCQHPLHVSITNVDFNNETKKFQVASKIFINDIEEVIYKKYNLKINAINLKKEEEKQLLTYINERLAILVNNKKQTLIYKQIKINDDAIWVYYEFKFVDKANNITIKNTILTDLFTDQANLVIINYKDIQKGVELRLNKEFETIEFL